MRKLFLRISIVLFSSLVQSSLLAQSEIGQGTPSYSANLAHQSLKLIDNSTIDVYSSVDMTNGSQTLQIRRKNTSGDMMYNQAFMTNEVALSNAYVAHLSAKSNGGFTIFSVIDYASIRIISFDSNNQMLWTKKYMIQDFFSFSSIFVLADAQENYYIGVTDLFTSSFLKLDSSGDVLWAKKPQSSGESLNFPISDVIINSSGNLLVASSSLSPLTFTYTPNYFEISSATGAVLSLLENDSMNNYTRLIAETSTGDYILVGFKFGVIYEVIIQKITPTGTVLNSKIINPNVVDLYDIRIGQNGKIYLLAARSPGLSVVVLNSDFSMNTIFSVGAVTSGSSNFVNTNRDSFVGQDPNDLTFKSFATSDNSQILIDFNGTISEICNSYLLGFNPTVEDTNDNNFTNTAELPEFIDASVLNIVFAFTLTSIPNFVNVQNFCDYIASTDDLNPNPSTDVIVYPNPSKGTLFIDYHSADKISQIRATSSDGKEVAVDFHLLENKVQIDLSKVTNGAYILEIIFENELRTMKNILLNQ